MAEVAVAELSDEERARFTYLRASNLLWAMADPVRAKEVIDEGAGAVRRGRLAVIDAVRGGLLLRDRPTAGAAMAAREES